LPCAARRRRGRLTVRPCTAADARASCARPFGPSSPSPAVLGTANGALVHEAVHPCTASGRMFASPQEMGEPPPLLLLLRQDAAQTGPPVARRAADEKARRV